ncbi:hypothetical protein Thiowin_04451 [Thiorhodovibrio winogradskyi]|uniref:Uncharacterized protein n=1 Tax=Thiorhodovibrio winogradskyi TaxID=77007 RepID=A0ABZ0SG90_9GAMM
MNVRGSTRGSWSVTKAVDVFGVAAFQASEVPVELSCTQEAHGRPGRTGAKSVRGLLTLGRMDGASLAR